MDYLAITNNYYANWLGVSGETMRRDGMHFAKSDQRDICQRGYPARFDLYIFVQDERIIVSYSSRASEHLGDLADLKAGDKPEYILDIVGHTYGVVPHSIVKFVFHHVEHNTTPVKRLTIDDYPLYLRFFTTNYPTRNIDWLYAYFREITAKRYSYGIMSDNLIVAATDAPGMPYMENEAQEIGINTLSNYRRRGYAKAVCTTAIDSLVSRDICPQWSCGAGNIASERLACSVGFMRLADVITATL